MASLCSLDAKYLSNRLLQYLASPYVLVIRVFKPTFLLLISSNLTNRGFATETILWFPGDFLNVRHIKRRSKRTMVILTSRRHRAAAHSLGQNVVFNIDRYDTLVMIYYYILYFLFSHYTVISLKIVPHSFVLRILPKICVSKWKMR